MGVYGMDQEMFLNNHPRTEMVSWVNSNFSTEYFHLNFDVF